MTVNADSLYDRSEVAGQGYAKVVYRDLEALEREAKASALEDFAKWWARPGLPDSTGFVNALLAAASEYRGQ